MDADSNALLIQLFEQLLATDRLLGHSATHTTSSTVAAGAEALIHRALSADEHKGIATHVAGDQDGLSNPAILLWDGWMSGREGACGSFAMDAETPHLAVDDILFDLGDVVTDIIDQRHILRACLTSKDSLKCLANAMHQELAISPGEVCAAGHSF